MIANTSCERVLRTCKVDHAVIVSRPRVAVPAWARVLPCPTRYSRKKPILAVSPASIIHAPVVNESLAPKGRAESRPNWGGIAGAFAVVAATTLFRITNCTATAAFGLPFASATVAGSPSWTHFLGLPVAVNAAFAGIAAGFLHTLAGPDHLAALAPLTVGRAAGPSAGRGALWGLGHSAGQLILGLAMVLLKGRFEQLVPALSKWGSVSVGLTLLLIGALGLKESMTCDDDGEAKHTHTHTPAYARSLAGTFATGLVYGLHPDALFVIVPALTLSSRLAATNYMVAFVLGTVAAMGGYAGFIGIMSQKIAGSSKSSGKKLSLIAALAAVVMGGSILVPAAKMALVAS